MEGTSSTAVVEPKKKSQDPAAKAKRIKRLLTNPDFAEAVEFERLIVKKYKQFVSEGTEHLKQSESTISVVKKQIERLVELQRYHINIEQFKENKGLDKVIETMRRSITATV
jgi:hypothetical protein